MGYAGIDIGSRYIKFAYIDSEDKYHFFKEETGYKPLDICRSFIEEYKPEKIIGTGYGRYLLEVYEKSSTMTEIKACARGSFEFFNNAKTIIDIGGQDTKVINLNSKGKVISFIMNDRCAAGTGKFVEMMASSLQLDLNQLSNLTLDDYKEDIKISSMCAVFAESEVISLITKGSDRKSIAVAITKSVAEKVVSLTKKNGITGDIVFTGGCARNKFLTQMISKELKSELKIAPTPDILSALGAALYAKESMLKTINV